MRRMLAMKEALPDWQFLRDILSRGLLDLDLVFDYRESAIANAVRSNDEILVAVRGQPLSKSGFGLLAFERIEKLVSKDWEISVCDNKAEGYEPGGAPTTFSKMSLLDSRRYAKYWNVQADLPGVKKWIIANALPQWQARAFKHPQAKKRSRPKRDPAIKRLQKMYPHGLPSKDELPDQALLEKCKGDGWGSDDTILRAATELREAQQSAEPQSG
jgi:hypothetical protein